MVTPLKSSTFQLPNAQTVETVYVRLDDGRIVPRRKDEVMPIAPRPAPGSPSKG